MSTKKSKESGKSKKKESLKGFESKDPILPAPKLPKDRERWKGPVKDQDRNHVYSYALYGASDDDIALVMEMSDWTLKTHFREELTKGRIDAKAKIGQRLYRFAVGDDEPGGQRPNLTALIFLAKTRCGYREVQVMENVQVTENVQIYIPDNGRGESDVKVVDNGS